MRPSAREALVPALTMLGLAAVYLLPLALHPSGVAFHPGSAYTDLRVSHLPNAAYLRDSLVTYRQWPLWNAQLFAGQPFAADPLSGMWYPPNLILLFVPLTVGFNILFWLHLVLGGLGMFRLLRAEGVGQVPAVLAGACFAGTPKLIAHIGAGHVSLIAGVAWTPWLLLAARRAAQTGGWRAGATSGAVLALAFLADVRWAYYAGLLAVGYGVWVWAESKGYGRRSPKSAGTEQSSRGKAQAARVGDLGRSHDQVANAEQVQRAGMSGALKAVLAAAVVAGLMAAPQALPLAELVQHSDRAALSLAEAGEFSLPPLYLLGLLIPDLGGFHEYMTYVGVVPLLLAVAGVGRLTAWWLAAALLAGLLALGVHGPLFELAFRILPGMGLLRVPPRAWFIVALSVCALAGHGAHRLASDWLPKLARRYGQPIGVRAATRVLGALLVMAVLDLVRVDATLVEARPMAPPTPAAQWIRAQPGRFRVYSPSYSLPPGDGLEHLDGVDPLQLSSAIGYAAEAVGVAAAGYSVTFPPFETANLATEHAGARLAAELLGRLNVRYVAAEFDVEAPGLTLVQQFDETRIYENEADQGRTWIEGGQGEAKVTFWSPNRVEVEATGPGTLVLSEISYPGWSVTVDRTPAQLETVDGVIRGVRVGAGNHVIRFEFRPWSVGAGLALGLAGLAAWWASQVLRAPAPERQR